MICSAANAAAVLAGLMLALKISGRE